MAPRRNGGFRAKVRRGFKVSGWQILAVLNYFGFIVVTNQQQSGNRSIRCQAGVPARFLRPAGRPQRHCALVRANRRAGAKYFEPSSSLSRPVRGAKLAAGKGGLQSRPESQRDIFICSFQRPTAASLWHTLARKRSF